MKKYDLSTEEGRQAYFDDRLAILKKHGVEITSSSSGGRGFGVGTDCAGFRGMDADCLKELIDAGFADPNETQNDSPDIATYLSFLQEHKEGSQLTAHGYLITPERSDVRVSVEGIEGILDMGDVGDFVSLFRGADELSLEASETRSFRFVARCWYD